MNNIYVFSDELAAVYLGSHLIWLIGRREALGKDKGLLFRKGVERRPVLLSTTSITKFGLTFSTHQNFSVAEGSASAR